MMNMLKLGMMVFASAALALSAAFISEDEVTMAKVKEVVSEQYGTKLDEDGDLLIKSDGATIILSLIDHKDKGIKYLSFTKNYSPYDKLPVAKMQELANQFNASKIFVRVAVDPQTGRICCDYFLTVRGGCSSEAILDSIDWVQQMCNIWEDLVTKAGEPEKAAAAPAAATPAAAAPAVAAPATTPAAVGK